jgi:hypothetical protein
MQWIDIPSERTTAATDAVLGLIALWAVVVMARPAVENAWRSRLWAALFGLLCFSSWLGAIVHGVKMPDPTRNFLWHPLNLSLGWMVGLFLTGAVYDAWGQRIARRILGLMLAVGLVFFGVATLWPDTFVAFVIYEGSVMIFALGIYGHLAWKAVLPGANLMVAGIVMTILAAGVQASSLTLNLIWPFDHNGLFHLVQMPGVVCLVFGLRAGIMATSNKTERTPNPVTYSVPSE